MTTTRIAIIGAGAIARAHAEAITDLPECRLTAVIDIDLNAAHRLAGPANAEALPSIDALLTSRIADAVIICTPPAFHESAVIATVRAGLPTLCEKPFAPTVAAAMRMADAATASGTLLTMASKFRFDAGVIAAKNCIDSGELGDITLVENAFTSRSDFTNRWHTDPAISGGGVIMDNGPHAADLIRFLLGPIHSVSANELAPRQLTVESSACLTFQTLSGIAATSLLSWATDLRRPWFLAIHGTNGTIEVGWGETRARFATGDWQRLTPGYLKRDCFRALVGNFVAAAQGKAALKLTLTDALAAVHTVEAAYQSLDQPNWINLTAFPESPHA